MVQNKTTWKTTEKNWIKENSQGSVCHVIIISNESQGEAKLQKPPRMYIAKKAPIWTMSYLNQIKANEYCGMLVG